MQIQAKQCEVIHLKEEYAQQLSDAQVMLLKSKSKFEIELREKGASREEIARYGVFVTSRAGWCCETPTSAARW